MADRSDLDEAVTSAWAATIGADRFDPDQPIKDTGADSLTIMRLLLHLEHRLGRRIPYDQLSVTTTARSLVSLLESGLPPPGPGSGANIFFLGGIGGDDAMLARLRLALREFSFAFVHAPDLDRPECVLRDVAASAQIIADHIDNEQLEGPLAITGYSYGGILAFEAIRALSSRGREIEMLCLLDAVPVRSNSRRLVDALRDPAKLLGKIRRLIPWRRSDRDRSLRQWLIAAACKFGAYGLASRYARADATPTNDGAWFADRMHLWQLRVEAGRRWRPQPINQTVNALLIVSDDGANWGTPRFWTKLLPNLITVHVPCPHDALDAFASAIKVAMNNALRA